MLQADDLQSSQGQIVPLSAVKENVKKVPYFSVAFVKHLQQHCAVLSFDVPQLDEHLYNL